MRRSINLLKTQPKYEKYLKYFKWVRYGAYAASAAFLLLVFLLFLILMQKNEQYNAKIVKRQELINFLSTNQKRETDFLVFGNKLLQTSTYMKDDVNFYPYYNILSESLKDASDEARFVSLVITNKKEVEFVVQVDSYSSLFSFFRFAESDKFSKYFDKLTLSQLDLAETKKNYLVTFKGKFKDEYQIKD